jgi:DNA gyrase/topoisomerase IV subunit B
MNLDEKYQVKSEIDHVLSRTGMWLGSTTTDVITYPLFIPSKNKIMQVPNVGHNAGLLKLIDEVLSNSIDEHRRRDSLFRISQIDIEVNSDGTVSIKDNGGIPIQLHKQTGLLIPELIFGHLRTSSNYDDTQEREVVGTNGLGAKLTNIFSKKFIVETSDNKNSVCIVWENNMRDSNKNIDEYPQTGFLIEDSNTHRTKISFKLELERFEMEEMPLSTIRIIQKRCIDAAAANPGLLITFKSNVADGKLDSEWQFNNFEEYVKLYLTDEQIPHILTYHSKKDTIIIIPDNLGFNFGFVNGAACSEGTHIKKIQSQLSDTLLDICQKQDMELLTEKDILSRLSIFVNTTIINPTYDSQTKERLTTKIDKFILNFSREFLNSLKDSELIQILKDYYEIRYKEIKQKEIRKLNAAIKTTKITKLIQAASKNPENSELWLFEGNSAGNGFRKARNLTQSAYLLRGKITNTFNLKREQILENRELREVIAATGILFDEPKKNVKACKYAKIVIASDMDYDGHHICGLLLAFFVKHFPELIRAGKVYRALSPIIIATKGSDKKYFYTMEDYEHNERYLKGYEIIYTKGLGGLSDDDYKQMLRNQKLFQFKIQDIEDIETISVWFDKSTEQRKLIILEDCGMLEEI